MFWIPLFVVASIIFIIRNANNANIKNRLDKKLISHESHYRVFANITRLTSEEKWEIEQKTKRFDDRIKVVHEFMNDQDKLWDAFTGCSHAAQIVLAAKMGKLYTDPFYDQTIPFTIRPKVCSIRTAYEMTEKFLLKIESELNNHGVVTTLVANYDGKNYESVRSHVRRFGYIENPGRVSFRWSNSLIELDDKFPHY